MGESGNFGFPKKEDVKSEYFIPSKDYTPTRHSKPADYCGQKPFRWKVALEIYMRI
jgi:hypothetical protein